MNVALATRGGKCSDASSNKPICGLAIDGSMAPFDSAWISNNEGVGAFIKLEFDGMYNILGVKLKQRLAKAGQIKEITLSFSDSSTQKVMMWFDISNILTVSHYRYLYIISYCTFFLNQTSLQLYFGYKKKHENLEIMFFFKFI